MRLKSTVRAVSLLSTSIAVMLAAQNAHAVDKFWEGNSGATWNSGANWSNNNTVSASNVAIPVAADDVFFHITGSLGGSGASMTLAGNQAARSITYRFANNFAIGSNSGTNTGNKSLTIGLGGLTKNSGTGTLSINGAVSASSILGRVDVVVGANQTWANNSTNAINLGTTVLSGTSPSVFTNVASATLGLGGNTLTLDGVGNFNFGNANTTTSVISGTSSASLIKEGTGTLSINGAANNTYAGSMFINAGSLVINGIATSTSLVTVGANGSLGGSGTLGAVTVSGTLTPGNSPGILTTGNQTWLNGADYNFQMLDATGTAGTGYDQIAITGTLDLSGLTSGGFGINLWSLASTGPDVNGNALNFNNAINQSWTILTTTGGISGFDAADFLVNVGASNDTGGFQNALGGGTFNLTATSDDLVLNFIAVPEPSAAFLGGLGMLALLRRRR
jgi:autotransporter-associated beta strand protein